MWFEFCNSWLELFLALLLHVIIGALPFVQKIHLSRAFSFLVRFMDGLLREKMGFELRKAGGVLTLFCLLSAVLAGWLLSVLGWPIRVVVMSFAFSFAGIMYWPRKAAANLKVHDISGARKIMPHYIKSDTDRLTEREGVSLSVLYIGHSMCDSLFAPLFWITVFSFFNLGTPAAVCWICIDLLDKKLGNRAKKNEDFGYIPAKLSDAAGYIPGFLGGWMTVLSCAILRFDFRQAIRTMDKYHNAHTSKNGGWAVAALSGGLGIQLGGDIREHGVVMHRHIIGESLHIPSPSGIFSALHILYVSILTASFFSLILLLIVR